MAGIEDLITLYRGERHTAYGGLDEAKKIAKANWDKTGSTFGRWFTPEKELAESYSRTPYKKDYKRKLKKVKISKKDLEFAKKLKKMYHTGSKVLTGFGEDAGIVLLPKKNLKDVKVIESNLVRDNLDVKKGRVKFTSKNLKQNLLKTFLSNAKALTPLAAKGLSFISSLPVATLTMVLQSTPANADEVNMTLEDFAKLAEANNIEMGSNMDKALPGGNTDI